MERAALLLTIVSVAACAGSGEARCPDGRNDYPASHQAGGEDVAASAVDEERRPEVRPLEDAERREAPTGQAWVTFLARGENAFVARLEMAPGASVPEHQDATEEYIHILEGTGTITVDGETTDVRPGTTVYMPAGATVVFQNGEERLVGIQVFAGPEPSAKYDRWTRASP